MEFIGKAIAVCELRSGTSSNGNGWQSQDYVFEELNPRNPQYPARMVAGLFGADKIQQANIVVGGMYHVFYDTEAREWQGRWFGSNRAWKIEVHNPAVQQSAEPQQQSPFPPSQPSAGAAADTAAPADGGQVTQEADALPF